MDSGRDDAFTLYQDDAGELFWRDREGDWLFWDAEEEPPGPWDVRWVRGRFGGRDNRGPIDGDGLDRAVTSAVPVRVAWPPPGLLRLGEADDGTGGQDRESYSDD